MKILAATDFSTRSNRALRQSGLLAQASQAPLHIVHVVDDDQPEQLVRMEREEAERLLAEQVRGMPELHGTQTHPLVVAGDPFDGILRAAALIKPDLIVMGAHRKQLLLDIFVGTTVERVIRKGSFPVLMVNFEAQRTYDRVVAAVDLSDASAHALRIALSMGLIGKQGATLLHAFTAMARGKMTTAGPGQSSIEIYVESERQRATYEVAAFMAAHDLQEMRWPLRVEEGAPREVVSQAVTELRPDLLVMGTSSRRPVMKALIGSVTEAALRTLPVDILVVPFAKG